MIGATRAIAESGGLAAGRIIVACVVDEEHASIGADALVTAWRTDAAVVTEPTELQVAVAHKGFEWVEVETGGAPRMAAVHVTAATPSANGAGARRAGEARSRSAVRDARTRLSAPPHYTRR